MAPPDDTAAGAGIALEDAPRAARDVAYLSEPAWVHWDPLGTDAGVDSVQQIKEELDQLSGAFRDFQDAMQTEVADLKSLPRQ